MGNFEGSFTKNFLDSIINRLPENTVDESFLYHGTLLDLEENIRRNGIQLKYVKTGDFSASPVTAFT